jgi:hypothetical protein
MGRPKGPQLERQTPIIFGQRYGSLVVIEEAPAKHCGKYRVRMVKCLCDCGFETITRFEYLKCGHTKSCGCNIKKISAKVRTTHGQSKTRLHGIWAGMLNRCRNKNVKSYKYYGAKGVHVCDEWLNFANFMDWAIDNRYRNNLTIDRKNPFGNYEPSNCQWIPKGEQGKNRRSKADVPS